MNIEDVCELLGKSKSALYRTVKYRDMPYIRQGNKLYFKRETINKWLDKKQRLDTLTRLEEMEKLATPKWGCYRNQQW